MMDDQPFRLRKQLQGAIVIFTVPTPGGETWDINPTTEFPGNEWIKSASTTNTWYMEERIDVSGLAMQDLTLFFASNRLQRGGSYFSTHLPDPAAGGALVYETVVVSDTPILNPDINIAQIVPSWDSSQEDFNNVKLGLGSVWTQSSSNPISLIQADSWSYGSDDPTASDTLFLYRWFSIQTGVTPQHNDQIIIPSVRYIGTGIATKEDELVYINRMRVSYEQAQTIL